MQTNLNVNGLAHGNYFSLVTPPGKGFLFFQSQVGAKMVVAPDGKVGIGTTNPTYALDVDTGSSTLHTYARVGSTDGISIGQGLVGADFRNLYAHSGVRNGVKIIANGPFPFVIEHADPRPIIFGTTDTERMRIDATGNVGIGTLSPTAKLEVAGTVKCQVLDLSGGADIAEKFDISGEFAPGMVVSPDPENDGKLRVSAQEYDRSAIGVLSGAGGIKVGMTLHQPGTAADGAHPVAVTGRVYVRADASFGEIKPGDELTSSATPGHAMKATDDARATRAVLGTALSTLKEGQGLVLIAIQRR